MSTSCRETNVTSVVDGAMIMAEHRIENVTGTYFASAPSFSNVMTHTDAQRIHNPNVPSLQYLPSISNSGRVDDALSTPDEGHQQPQECPLGSANIGTAGSAKTAPTSTDKSGQISIGAAFGDGQADSAPDNNAVCAVMSSGAEGTARSESRTSQQDRSDRESGLSCSQGKQYSCAGHVLPRTNGTGSNEALDTARDVGVVCSVVAGVNGDRQCGTQVIPTRASCFLWFELHLVW